VTSCSFERKDSSLLDLTRIELDDSRRLRRGTKLSGDTPYFASHLIPWETVEETPGIRVTRWAKKGSMATMLEELMQHREKSEDLGVTELKVDGSEEGNEELQNEQVKFNNVQPGLIQDLDGYDEAEEDVEDETLNMVLDNPGRVTRANVKGKQSFPFQTKLSMGNSAFARVFGSTAT